MEKIISFNKNLDMFKRIVLVYKNEKGETFIGSSFHDSDSEKNFNNYIVLYKDALPSELDCFEGWNFLDDNSDNIYLVPIKHSEVAVDDFLVAHHIDKTWKDLDYNVVNNITEINSEVNNNALQNNEVRAYGILA